MICITHFIVISVTTFSLDAIYIYKLVQVEGKKKVWDSLMDKLNLRSMNPHNEYFLTEYKKIKA